MLSAAKALCAGVTDPISFLSHAGPDWDVACVTVEKALALQSEARGEEWKSVTKRIGVEVGNTVAHAISRMFSGA